MKIFHLANWHSTNIGNGALGLGAERVIAEDIPGVTFVREAWDDYTFGLKRFDERFVEIVNAHDALLVNGAVTFNSFRRRMFNTGCRFDLPLPLWEKIRVPIVFYGVSYMNWPKQPYPNAHILKQTLEYIVKSDHILFAVRNDGTKDWLARVTGIKSERIHEIPDPGLYVPAQKGGEYPELDPKKKNIIIAFNNENEAYRYGGKFRELLWSLLVPVVGDERLERFFKRQLTFLVRRGRGRAVRRLARAVEKIVARYPKVQFILVPHYLDDYAMIGDFIAAVNERVAHQLTVSTGLLKTSATEYFYGRYAKADLAFAMRIHSMSPSVGLGVPVIPLTYAGRMGKFLSNAGLADIAIDLFSDFEDVLADRAAVLLADPSPLKRRLAEATARMREATRRFNASTLAPFLHEKKA